jgi:hypothetical protein
MRRKPRRTNSVLHSIKQKHSDHNGHHPSTESAKACLASRLRSHLSAFTVNLHEMVDWRPNVYRCPKFHGGTRNYVAMRVAKFFRLCREPCPQDSVCSVGRASPPAALTRQGPSLEPRRKCTGALRFPLSLEIPLLTLTFVRVRIRTILKAEAALACAHTRPSVGGKLH